MHRTALLSRFGPTTLTSLAMLLGASSCNLAGAIRPNAPTYAEAIGEGGCTGTNDPLVVDWKPESRGDLEGAMRGGLAVVSFDCRTLKLLRDCTVEGAYGYMGMTTKEQLVRLENADELRANLPLQGPALGVQLGEELRLGTTLDVALVMVGKRRVARDAAMANELRGPCAGATHFVRGATVGAFVLQTGSRASSSSVVDIFKGGVAATTASAKFVRQQDGSLDACRSANPEGATPPSQCGALVRLELVPINAAPPEFAQPQAVSCPPGMGFYAGKCTPSAPSRQCVPGDANDCNLQCSRGDAVSCHNLAELFDRGQGVPKDPARAAMLFQQSCQGGSADACSDLGAHLRDGAGVPRDEIAAVQLHQRACMAGAAAGCDRWAAALSSGRGTARDEVRAAALWDRGCRGGHAPSCGKLGMNYMRGDGVPRDTTRGLELLKAACAGGALCVGLGMVYKGGRGMPRNDALALDLFKRACARGDQLACTGVANMKGWGRGAPRDDAAALDIFRRVCAAGTTYGCTRVGLMTELGRGTPQNLAQAAAIYARSCETGATDGCASLAMLHHFGGGVPRDKAREAWLLAEACHSKTDANCSGSLVNYSDDCGSSDGRSCAIYGYLLRYGPSVARSPAAATAALKRACELEDLAGCGLLRMP